GADQAISKRSDALARPPPGNQVGQPADGNQLDLLRRRRSSCPIANRSEEMTLTGTSRSHQHQRPIEDAARPRARSGPGERRLIGRVRDEVEERVGHSGGRAAKRCKTTVESAFKVSKTPVP